jgi:uncharacterized protein YajQ (UPF0234 family)
MRLFRMYDLRRVGSDCVEREEAQTVRMAQKLGPRSQEALDILTRVMIQRAIEGEESCTCLDK